MQITLEQILKKNPPGEFIIWLFRFLPDRKGLQDSYNTDILIIELMRSGPEHPYIRWVIENLYTWRIDETTQIIQIT